MILCKWVTRISFVIHTLYRQKDYSEAHAAASAAPAASFKSTSRTLSKIHSEHALANASIRVLTSLSSL